MKNTTNKPINKINTLFSVPLSLALFISMSFGASANNSKFDKDLFSLKNLERERAALIATFLNNNLSVEKKHAKLMQQQRQLADMERMVLRDERLLSHQSNMVKRAFNDYDTTFLVHAGAENELNAMNQWLLQVNLSNQSIFETKAGYR
ncbi:hypothetical protein [Alteromonas sp. W364]|uniref:hypothetical protein n=1 Tax=Alteromonas sp. W364 TaxID=3075610 RepID=UPI00288425C7|nr:hypothetical protein [Alteromonas sp. W364]MDT0626822.1 hypothetical protein [Alteromonas sp. W364]